MAAVQTYSLLLVICLSILLTPDLRLVIYIIGQYVEEELPRTYNLTLTESDFDISFVVWWVNKFPCDLPILIGRSAHISQSLLINIDDSVRLNHAIFNQSIERETRVLIVDGSTISIRFFSTLILECHLYPSSTIWPITVSSQETSIRIFSSGKTYGVFRTSLRHLYPTISCRLRVMFEESWLPWKRVDIFIYSMFINLRILNILRISSYLSCLELPFLSQSFLLKSST